MAMREALTGEDLTGRDTSKALVAKKGGQHDKTLQPCFKFAAGTCERGDNCIYAHSTSPSPAPQWIATEMTKSRPCRFWNSKGGCRFGDGCIFKHDEEYEDDAAANDYDANAADDDQQ